MGTWQPDRDSLAAIRDHIVTKPGPYLDAIEHEPFTEFYELSGTKLSRPPKGYDIEHDLIEEIKRKDFIAVCPLQESDLYQPDFCKMVASRFGRAQPFQKFICEALGLRF